MTQSPIKLSSPNDLIATVPYLVGEPPEVGLVTLGLCGGALRWCALRDFQQVGDGDTRANAQSVVGPASAQGCDNLIIIGYGSGGQVTAHVDQIVTAAWGRGLTVRDALRVNEGRYWSYTCRDSSCCPPEGTPIDPDRSTGPAEAIVRGATRDRGPVVDPVAEARRSLEPSATVRPDEVRAAVDAAKKEVVRLLRSGARGLNSYRTTEVYTAVEGERTNQGPDSVADLVRLAVFLHPKEVRDAVGLRILPETARIHLDLWSRVTRTAPPAFRAAPATLVAIAAWVDGNLPMAQAAINTALTVDADYTMARLLQRSLAVGVPPEKWIEALRNQLDREAAGSGSPQRGSA